MTSRKALLAIAALAIAAPAMASAQAIENSYRSRLTSAAFTPAQGMFEGDGDVVATLKGRVVTLAGNYKAMGSPVTRVRLLGSIAPGVPSATPMAELSAPGGVEGAISSGNVLLTAAQVAQLKAGRLYVQVETQAAPDGALWGWLMPNHRFPGEKVPEKANWYAQ